MKFKLFLLAASAAMLASTPAHAQTAPSAKPIEVVISFPPGGASDMLARILAEQLRTHLGRTAVVSNKPGGNGAIANNYVRRAPADGSVLFVISRPFTTAPATDPSVHKYDPVVDFTPIARVTTNAMALIASAKTPFGDVPSLIKYAAANPEKVTVATVGMGASDHLGALQIAQAAGVKFTYVHYKGSAPGVQDLMGGVVDLKFDSYTSLKPAIDSGRVKFLAFATRARYPQQRNIPTIGETIPGLEITSYFGVVGPPGMSRELTRQLSKVIRDIVSQPDITKRLNDLGMDIDPQDADEFSTFMSQHLKSQQTVIREAGLKVE